MINKKINEAIDNFTKLLKSEATHQIIQEVSDKIIQTIKSGHKILICGNGGSAADAQHFAGEFLCRFYKNRRALPCIALTTDTSTLTAIANDYSYEDVFSRQLEGLGNEGDLLIGISTSGSSKNVLRAFEAAKKIKIKTVLLTGAARKEIAAMSDLVVSVPSQDTPRVQEMLLLVEHIICETVENAFENEK